MNLSGITFTLVNRFDFYYRKWYNRDMANTLDARGIPTAECPSCESTIFTAQISFDEDYNLAGYLLNAECAFCKTLVSLPTPLDHVEYSEYDSRWV